MNPNQCAIYVPKIVNIVNRKADIIDSLVYKYHDRRMCLCLPMTFRRVAD